jgi:hypothetical protein
MTLVKRATNGDVVWMRRSVVRRPPPTEGAEVEPDRFEVGILPAVGREPNAENAPVVDLRVAVDMSNSVFEAVFEVIARFFFADDDELPSDQEVREFVGDYGLEYAIGYVRAALADDLRVFGFPAGIMPPGALDDAKTVPFMIARAENA